MDNRTISAADDELMNEETLEKASREWERENGVIAPATPLPSYYIEIENEIPHHERKSAPQGNTVYLSELTLQQIHSAILENGQVKSGPIEFCYEGDYFVSYFESVSGFLGRAGIQYEELLHLSQRKALKKYKDLYTSKLEPIEGKKLSQTPLGEIHAQIKQTNSQSKAALLFNVERRTLNGYLMKFYNIPLDELRTISEGELTSRFPIEEKRICRSFRVWVNPAVEPPKNSFIHSISPMSRVFNCSLQQIHEDILQHKLDCSEALKHYLPEYYPGITFGMLRRSLPSAMLNRLGHKYNGEPKKIEVWMLPKEDLSVSFLNKPPVLDIPKTIINREAIRVTQTPFGTFSNVKRQASSCLEKDGQNEKKMKVFHP
ncbi:MAG: hypothetical protein EPO11_11190 [Gammaproteobacteria bacterium]|nr:MAG: hypothetical protein EPO11_11190 [Gammaproteobacteria bacterium]